MVDQYEFIVDSQPILLSNLSAHFLTLSNNGYPSLSALIVSATPVSLTVLAQERPQARSNEVSYTTTLSWLYLIEYVNLGYKNDSTIQAFGSYSLCWDTVVC